MAAHERRANARRKARSRGPKILRFEPLEARQLLSTTSLSGTSSGTLGGTAETTSAQTLPNLVAVKFQAEGPTDWGESVSVRGKIANQGHAKAQQGFLVDVYVSAGETVGNQSVRIGSIEVPQGLAPGEVHEFEADFLMPTLPISGLKSGFDNTVHLGLVVDSRNDVAESDESDNIWQGRGKDSAVVLISPQSPAFLVGRSLRLDQNVLHWGETVKLNARLENVLDGEAPSSKARVVLTPWGKSPGGADDVTIGHVAVPALPGRNSVEVSAEVHLPDAPFTGQNAHGNYMISMIPDGEHEINASLTPITMQGQGLDWELVAITPDPESPIVERLKPDLAASDVLAPGTPLVWGQTFQVAAKVHNLGQAYSGPLKVRFLLGGPNGETVNSLVLGDTTIDNIPPGEAHSLIQTLQLPGKLPFGVTPGDGLGRIIVQVDPDNLIDEISTANNAAASAQLVPLRLYAPDNEPPPPSPPNPSEPPAQPNPPRPEVTRPSLAERQRLLEERRAQMQVRREEMLQRRGAPPSVPNRPQIPRPANRPGLQGLRIHRD